MNLILDTSFLIELKKGNKKAVEALNERKEDCEDIVVSTLTVYELLVGANYIWKKHGNAKEMMIISDMLKALTVVPVDLDVVKRASEVKAELILRGIDVPDLDILIACSTDGEILTFDKDFNPLKELGFKISFLGDEDE
ncbi:PilT protein domain protein [Ferroglobus placidus DSM 10642]|uniref:PilT protein domain protein n=1 Tax=Ferroglobus placidus (strain DSM 10642 / AEDII12DO) TaxID=589924 RepID=D3S0D9_FERPA|nr:type II toxin-antitoxin system VapC family toxin [Ferroglobus placidus]ADC66202.1 PilT protein domain protein [Ferroglobus placidus DSM 10642]